jgi:undecaprenyl-diphosphatase
LSLAKGALGAGEKSSGKLAWGIVLATIPGAAAGLLFEDHVETIFRQPERIAASLIIFGILLGAADRFGRKDKSFTDIHWKIALGIGCAQALAIMPGVSRSGSTMTAALLLGLSRVEAARYSF